MKYFLITLSFLCVVILFLLYKSQGIKRMYKSEVKKGLERNVLFDKSFVTKEDIEALPVPVQKYLNYVGVIGKKKVQNVRMVTEINTNLGGDKGWTKMKTEEYDFFDDQPARLAFMRFKTKGMPVFGFDSYINKRGWMLMKPLGLFAVVDAKGKEMDNTSAAVLLLSSMCISAPSTLIDERIKWTVVDPLEVIATFNDNGCRVSAVLDFNEKGELINFSTEDKYYAPTGETYQKVRWSTPVLNYKELNGMKLSTYGEAIWHFPEGDSCYGKLTLKEIEYNCKSFK